MFEKFKEKVRKWWATVETLQNTVVPLEHEEEKAALIRRAKLIRKGIDVVPGLSEWIGLLPSNLGLIPLIPLAVVSGTTALIVGWLTDHAQFMSKVDIFNSSLEKGQSPEQARANVRALTESPSFSLGVSTGSFIMPLIIVGVGLWLLKLKR